MRGNWHKLGDVPEGMLPDPPDGVLNTDAVPQLPTRETVGPPKNFLGRWLYAGNRMDAREPSGSHTTHPWYLVLWLTGVDYFSTLGYQPGIALLAAGAVSPIATAILVLVTLTCALPIYAQVAQALLCRAGLAGPARKPDARDGAGRSSSWCCWASPGRTLSSP